MGTKLRAIVIVGAVTLLGYVVTRSLAAGPLAAFEPEAGTLASGAIPASITGASGSGVIQFATTTTPTPSPTPEPLLSTNFESAAISAPISIADYRNAMGDQTMAVSSGNLTNTSVVSEGGSHGNFLRQTLPANASGGGSGIVTFPKLSQTVDSASIQYDIRFSTGFEWSYGGKLPGLGGARDGTNPGDAAGCKVANDYSWSGRGMWISPGSYPNSSMSPNEWIGYLYTPNRVNACGDNIQSDRVFVAGQWHTIKQYYQLNTPGQANGIHKMWIDGQQVVNLADVIFRTAPDIHVSHLFWAIFRGGGSSDTNWQSGTTSAIDIDNLYVNIKE